MLKKNCYLLLLLIALFIGLDRYYHPKSLRFAPSKIMAISNSPEWELPPLSKNDQKKVDAILNQKFTYLDNGSQSYVFISEDKKHVLKFLKQGKLHPKTWLAYIPVSLNPYYKESLALQEKLRKTYHAQKIAFTEFKNQTGYLYVHLNRTAHLNKKVDVRDKKGKKHTIFLDHACFSLQKKADLLYPRLNSLLEQKNIEGAKKAIASLVLLMDCFVRKGVVDNDPILRKNFGLIDEEAIQFDIGRLRIDPLTIRPDHYQMKMSKLTNSLKKWIHANCPELLPYYEQTLMKTQAQNDKH
jgi:hypothetical protein